MAMFIPIVMMTAIQRILISSCYSKRIYAIAVAIGFFLVLNVESSYFFSLYLNPMTVKKPIIHDDEWVGTFPSSNFNIMDKFIFHLNPMNYTYYIVYISNIFSINVINNDTPTIPNVLPVSIPFLFKPPENQFIYIFIIQVIIFMAGIKLIKIIKDKVSA